MSLVFVAAQTLVIYLFLSVALSRMGRSLMAGLTHLNYLVIALLGSAVETGLYRGSNTLSAGLVSAGTLLAGNLAASWSMNRWPRLRRLLTGGPLLLVHDGQLLHAHLRQVWLSEED